MGKICQTVARRKKFRRCLVNESSNITINERTIKNRLLKEKMSEMSLSEHSSFMKGV